MDNLFNLFQKYEYCPSKYDRDFARKHDKTLRFLNCFYFNFYSFEKTFRLLPGLIMNSVNRHHIPYKSLFSHNMQKVVPLLARKMLKYGFGNVKFIGKYRCSSKDEFEKFVTSHRPTKCISKYYEVYSFHHCKKCKDLTSQHRRSMFAFYCEHMYCNIFCFILF